MADGEKKDQEDQEKEKKEGQHFTLEVNDGFLTNVTKKER